MNTIRCQVRRMLWILAAVLTTVPVFAQLDTAFWYAVPHITHDHAGRPIKLCVSTLGQPATITVTKPAAGNAVVNTFTVPANSSQSYQLVGGGQGDLSNIAQFECNHNTTSNYGLYIHSTAKVNAYIAVQNNNSEIYALKGNNALGTHFFITMQYQYTNATNYSDARNSVEVIATENNTSVTITPSVALYGGTHPANVPFTITLNRGQVYSFASASQTGANHLCGTIITSNKPIAVDVSDDSATPNGSNQDLVADQLVPEDRAGSEYIVIPSPSAANNTMSGAGLSDYAFIFALEDSTDVTVYYQNGTSLSQQSYNNLMRGDKRSYHFTNNNPIFIWARHVGADGIPVAKPVFVFQLTGAGNELGGTQLPHIYCTGSTAAAYMPLAHPQGSNHVKHLFLTLICAEEYINGFQINGVSSIAASEWQTVPGHTMRYCRKDISSMATQQVIRVTNSLGKFHMGVIDYHQPGSGYDDCSISYFSDYGTKSSLTWATDEMSLDYCQGDTVVFAFDTTYAEILRVEGPNGWFTTTAGSMSIPSVTPDQSGMYVVVGQDSRECSVDQLYDTINITIHPSVEAVVYDTVCPGEEYDGFGFHISEDRTETPGTVLESAFLQTFEYGCDSLLILELTVRDSVKKEVVYDTTCPGEEYFGFGHFHFPPDSTVASRTLIDTVSLTPVGCGCDSLLILHLAVRDSAIGEFSHIACNRYSFNGHTYEESGDYPDIVLTNASVYGCDSIVTMHLTILEPSVEILSTGDLCEVGEMILNAESEYGEFIWNTGETTPFITVLQPGVYTVTVTEGECQAEDQYVVPACEFNLFMPNCITPSRSDGLNDYLYLPEYVHRFISDFDIEIFNRWGELIFKTNDVNFRWAGENANLSQVYVYVIRIKDLDGKPFIYKGTVTVL